VRYEFISDSEVSSDYVALARLALTAVCNELNLGRDIRVRFFRKWDGSFTVIEHTGHARREPDTERFSHDHYVGGLSWREDPNVIAINVELSEREMIHTVLHEAKHAQQARQRGGSATRPDVRAAYDAQDEEDAEQFATSGAACRSMLLATIPYRPPPLPAAPSPEASSSRPREVMRVSQPGMKVDVDPETGIFRGLASATGVPIDAAVPTIIEAGSFRQTLMQDADRVVVLWQHDMSQPIGLPIEMRETPEGLQITGKISKTDLGLQALRLMADGVTTDLSIGFDPVEWSFDQSNVRHITSLRLYEISVVTMGANPGAKVAELRHARSPAALEGLVGAERAKLGKKSGMRSRGVHSYGNWD
jgi:HK97 family phage prohead protease